jgi:O-antigen/teichoic acid export membrane protein
LLGRKSLLIMISRILSAGLSFIGLYFITRYLGPEIYGSISFTLALIGTFNVVADLGLNTAHIKRVSEGQNIADCVSTFIVAKIFLIGLMVVTTLLSILAWTWWMGNDLPAGSLSIVFVFIAYFIFIDLGQIAIVTFDARIQSARSQLIHLLEPLSRVPMVVIISLIGLGALQLAYTYLIGGGFLAVGGLLLMNRSRFRWRRPTLLRSYISFALPLAAVAIMSTLATNLDKILLGSFSTETTVGLYAAAQSILGLMAIIGTAINTLVFPTFSKYHSTGNIRGIRNMTVVAERYILLLALPAVMVIVLLPTEVSIILLGPQFVGSGGPMRFLAVSVLMNMLNGLYLNQVNAMNRPDLTAKIVLISVCVNITLLLLLIPTRFVGVEMFGLAATGAAVANMCYFLTTFVISRLVCSKMTRTGLSKRLLLHLAGAMITGAVIFLLSGFWNMGSWIDLIIYGLVAVGVYWAFLYLVRELGKDDIKYFLSSLNPRKMGSYVKEELRERK